MKFSFWHNRLKLKEARLRARVAAVKYLCFAERTWRIVGTKNERERKEERWICRSVER